MEVHTFNGKQYAYRKDVLQTLKRHEGDVAKYASILNGRCTMENARKYEALLASARALRDIARRSLGLK